MDIFPHTTERAETVVDQFGRIDRQMTYFLSSRAMLKLCAAWADENPMIQ